MIQSLFRSNIQKLSDVYYVSSRDNKNNINSLINSRVL